jgi:hypothetical protein
MSKKYNREPEEWQVNVTGRVVYKMTKYRAKTELVFTEDPEDPWFILEYTVERKSKKVTSCSIFIAKDMPTLVRHRASGGWVLEVIEEPIEECARINNHE